MNVDPSVRTIFSTYAIPEEYEVKLLQVRLQAPDGPTAVDVAGETQLLGGKVGAVSFIPPRK